MDERQRELIVEWRRRGHSGHSAYTGGSHASGLLQAAAELERALWRGSDQESDAIEERMIADRAADGLAPLGDEDEGDE